MKTRGSSVRRTHPRAKRIQAHSIRMYKAHKEVFPGGMRNCDFLNNHFPLPSLIVHRLVSSEASRLSKSNRRKVITRQELSHAVSLVRKRICTRSAA